MTSRKNILTTKDMMSLIQSGKELTAQIGIEELLQQILNKASELTDSPDTSIWLRNDERETLYVVAATGDQSDWVLSNFGISSEEQAPIKGSKVGQVYRTGRSIVENVVKGHYAQVDQETHKVTQSMVCVPMIVGGKPLGAMQILNKCSGRYTKRDQVLLEHFAAQAAVAIRNAQLFDKLLSHMGLYSSRENNQNPIDLMSELENPVHSERLSVLFADMRGFTQLCQSLAEPHLVQRRLNQFITMLADEVIDRQGMVNKFLGDGVLALFRGANCSQRAVETAFGMVEQFHTMKLEWDEQSNQQLEFLDIGIGIVTDQVLLGGIGSARVRDFTVIGNPVNLAAAFKSDARNGRRILVDQLTYLAVKDNVEEIEGPNEFVIQKVGYSIATKYKQYHLKSMRRAVQTRVFISHNHRDRKFVEKHLVRPLNESGIQTWYCADDIPKGAAWTAAIRKGLAASHWVIVVVSESSAHSRWVKKEIDLAVVEERFDDRIIPVLLDDVDLKQVNDYLVTMQAVDARQEEDLANLIRDHIMTEPLESKNPDNIE